MDRSLRWTERLYKQTEWGKTDGRTWSVTSSLLVLPRALVLMVFPTIDVSTLKSRGAPCSSMIYFLMSAFTCWGRRREEGRMERGGVRKWEGNVEKKGERKRKWKEAHIYAYMQRFWTVESSIKHCRHLAIIKIQISIHQKKALSKFHRMITVGRCEFCRCRSYLCFSFFSYTFQLNENENCRY